MGIVPSSQLQIQFLEDRLGPEFLLVRHPAKAHYYKLASMLSDGGKDDTGKTSLGSHADSTIATRLDPVMTDEEFKKDLKEWTRIGPPITDIIASGWTADGGVQAKDSSVEFDVSAEAVCFEGRWFNQCRLYSIDEQQFWMQLKEKKLQQDAPGIRGNKRFFIITEAYVAKSVGELRQVSADASARIGATVGPTAVATAGATAGATVGAEATRVYTDKEATLAFKIVEVIYDENGKIGHMNLVPNPRQHYTLDPKREEKPAQPPPKRGRVQAWKVPPFR